MKGNQRGLSTRREWGTRATTTYPKRKINGAHTSLLVLGK